MAHKTMFDLDEAELARLRGILEEERRNQPMMLRPEELCMWDPVKEDAGGEEIEIPKDSNTNAPRKGNVYWCKCKHCTPMYTEEESMCCKEIPKIQPYIKSGEECICEVDYFKNRILDPEHIQNLHMFERLHSDYDYPNFFGTRHRDYRRVTYWAFTKWVHKHMNARKKRRIPACVVGAVRAQYPFPDDLDGEEGTHTVKTDGFAEDFCAKYSV
ncbi:uncharacterized protein LOC128636137 [Bombina bombina]|uniref:uncharacterized protein LOC128636137 n=1 Tax=Bombina bombina TaxID=8345 RepID=UPI00235AC905|nr:uncharacterized protein LOC128636137 [Bombina bombina]